MVSYDVLHHIVFENCPFKISKVTLQCPTVSFRIATRLACKRLFESLFENLVNFLHGFDFPMVAFRKIVSVFIHSARIDRHEHNQRLSFLVFSAHQCVDLLEENGNFTYTNRTYYQSVATLLSCHSGYLISMVNTTVCQANETWAMPIPKCEGE